MRCLSAVFVLVAAPATAGTIVVDNDFADCPQATFTSINLAVADAMPGDKILVCPGVYLEAVLVDKSDLRIEAQAAPGEVVLQGTAADPFGFHLLNTTSVLLQGFTVQGFGTANIIIDGGSGNTLRKNVATLGVIDGIEVISSSANVVEHNTSSFNNQTPFSDGIFVFGAAASDNIIRHNETFQNSQAGVHLFSTGRGNVVFRNDSHNNRFGIRNVVLSHASVIENNYVFANVLGIVIGNSTGVTARNNRSRSNIESGIRLQNGAANNLVEKNEVLQNTQDGILLQNNVDANIVQLNHVRENGRDGIRVVDAASVGNTIERNVIRESGEDDAHDDSLGSGTGGTANFWIENKCETENRPGLCKNP